MKKIFLLLLATLTVFSFYKPTNAKSDELYYEDLTTLNFSNHDELDFHTIKKLCTYDYCNYIKGESLREALEIFTREYLKTIPDEEVKSILNVKGIRITKIILLNK